MLPTHAEPCNRGGGVLTSPTTIMSYNIIRQRGKRQYSISAVVARAMVANISRTRTTIPWKHWQHTRAGKSITSLYDYYYYYVCMYVGVFAFVCVCVRVSMYTCMYAQRPSTSPDVHFRICVYTYMCIHIFYSYAERERAREREKERERERARERERERALFHGCLSSLTAAPRVKFEEFD